MRPTARFILLAALGVAIGACSPEETVEATTTTALPTTTSTGTAEPTTTTTSPPATTTTAPETAGSDCVVGTWELASDRFLETIQEEVAELGDATISHGGGSYTVEFGPDGTMTAVRDDWVIRVETADGTFVQTINSTETGPYTLDEEAGTMMVDLASESFDLDIQVEVDGEMLDLPNVPDIGIPEGEMSSSGSYTCSGDTLTVTTDDGIVSEFERR